MDGPLFGVILPSLSMMARRCAVGECAVESAVESVQWRVCSGECAVVQWRVCSGAVVSAVVSAVVEAVSVHSECAEAADSSSGSRRAVRRRFRFQMAAVGVPAVRRHRRPCASVQPAPPAVLAARHRRVPRPDVSARAAAMRPRARPDVRRPHDVRRAAAVVQPPRRPTLNPPQPPPRGREAGRLAAGTASNKAAVSCARMASMNTFGRGIISRNGASNSCFSMA